MSSENRPSGCGWFTLGVLVPVIILCIVFWPFVDFFIRVFLNYVTTGRSGLW